jgi:hypothetical protein
MLTREIASTAEMGVVSGPECSRFVGGVTMGNPERFDKHGRVITAVSVVPGASLWTDARKALIVISLSSATFVLRE